MTLTVCLHSYAQRVPCDEDDDEESPSLTEQIVLMISDQSGL